MSVLKALNECFEHGNQAHYTWKIAEDAGLPTDYATCALISLRNRGLVIYLRGLFNDEGMTAGSGYAITVRGKKHLAAKQGPVLQGRYAGGGT